MSTSNHYCAVSTADVQTTVDFYVRAFAGQVVGGWNKLKFPGDHILELPTQLVAVGGGIVEIAQAAAKEGLQEYQQIGLNHLCIPTDDCDRDYERAIKFGGKGCPMVRGELEWDGSPTAVELDDAARTTLKIAFLKGPNGEMIELLQHVTPERAPR